MRGKVLLLTILVAGCSSSDSEPDRTLDAAIEVGPDASVADATMDDAVEVGSDASDATADARVEATAPPKGVEACKAWELGEKPIEAMASCDDALGSARVACVEATMPYWHASCAGDCVGTGNDYTTNLDCYCECMVIYASPYDPDAGQDCELDFSHLYNCWVSESW